MSSSRYAVDIDPAEQNTSHALRLELVVGDKRVLDVGCAEGDLARALVRRGCTVSGVEYDAAAAEKARPDLEQVLVVDLSSTRPRWPWRTRFALSAPALSRRT